MNRNSKLSKVLSVIALMLCFALLFCACNTPSNDDGSDSNPPAGDTTPDTPDSGNEDPDTTPDDEKPGDENDGKVTYTVNTKDLDGNPIAGVEVQFCVGDNCKAPVYSDTNGVATITLDPEDYHVKINPGVYAADPAEYEFPEGSTTLDVTVYKLPTGSEDEPIPVTENETQVKLKAGAKLYYTVFMPGDKVLTIDDVNSRGAVIEYNGKTYTSENGKVQVALEGGMMANIAVSAADGKLAVFTLKVSVREGSSGNPFTLENLDPITVNVPENDSVHYKWIATASGTLTVSCANDVNDITLNNNTAAIYGDPSDGAASVSITVNEGDEITLIFAVCVVDESTWTTPAAELSVTFTLA
ncbi:MAG: hypothetical protein E7626_02425 [Ruminococcaceae bacterium]|nr:hypothetical protein [Oscillospiraceae bacterium]